MSSYARLGFIIAALAFVADRVSKDVMLYPLHFAQMAPGQTVPVLPFFNLMMVWNPGISYGLFPASGWVGTAVLAVVAAAAVAVLSYLLWHTRAKSLAIGTPADGYYAIHTMKESGGFAEDVSDEEIVEGIRLLAEYAGIFAETAGGVTVACAKKLIEAGKIPADESAVLCITGNGLKTQEAIAGKCGEPRLINPSLREFDETIGAELAVK